MTLNGRSFPFRLKLFFVILIFLFVYSHPEIELWKSVPLDLLSRFQAPSVRHWFGTDWLGRDILLRTLQGLAGSLQIGLLSALLCGFIAFLMAVLGQLSKEINTVVTIIINALMAIPHLLLLILISLALGGERQGLIIAIALTHWPKLSRILYTELLQLRHAHWIQASLKLGKSWIWISRHHLLPHILPQLLVGTGLIIPHAILTASAMTFVGFGLSPGTARYWCHAG